MVRFTVLLAVLTAFLSFPVSHSAADQLPYPTDRPVSNSRTMTAIAAAQQLLPNGQCQPRFYVAVLPPDKLGFAMNDPGACIAWIPPAVAYGHGRYQGWKGRVLACTISEHEALHELGYTNPVGFTWPDGRVDHTHSPDRESLMFAFAADKSVSWPCARRFIPHGRWPIWHRDYPGLVLSTFP